MVLPHHRRLFRDRLATGTQTLPNPSIRKILVGFIRHYSHGTQWLLSVDGPKEHPHGHCLRHLDWNRGYWRLCCRNPDVSRSRLLSPNRRCFSDHCRHHRAETDKLNRDKSTGTPQLIDVTFRGQFSLSTSRSGSTACFFSLIKIRVALSVTYMRSSKLAPSATLQNELEGAQMESNGKNHL